MSGDNGIGDNGSGDNGNGTDKLHELIEGQRVSMITTRDEAGDLVSRPISVQKSVTRGELLFLVRRSSDVMTQALADPRVNVAFTENNTWVSVSGTADMLDDRELVEELWSAFAAAFFDSEPTDPEVVVLRVTAQSAEYWESPGTVRMLFGVAKHRLTGEEPDDGEHGTLTL